jgi:hypothetical protein
MRSPRTIAAIAALVLSLGLFGGLVVDHPVHAAPAWAPAATAPIHPGVQTRTPAGQCTANFVFYDATNVYIGQAAHCSGTGTATDTDGCTSGSLPLGTKVTVGGASQPGTMVYNSWLTMQAAGEKDPDTCAFNDLALVQLDPADVGKVNPTVPKWGGPSGLARSTGALEQVFSYGNSSLRLGITQLSPKTGVSLGSMNGNWTQIVYTVTPGIPGDSGSGFMNSNGQAFGVLSTLNLAPFALGNGVGGLANELDYMHSHSSFTGVQLAPGTEPFHAGLPL